MHNSDTMILKIIENIILLLKIYWAIRKGKILDTLLFSFIFSHTNETNIDALAVEGEYIYIKKLRVYIYKPLQSNQNDSSIMVLCASFTLPWKLEIQVLSPLVPQPFLFGSFTAGNQDYHVCFCFCYYKLRPVW